jgi:hypothetical protein
MASHRARLYHAGGRVPARSTFADANRTRNPLVFSGLLERLLGMASRGLRREMREAVRLIEKTSLHLAGIGTEWAKHRKCPSDAEGRFSADVCGAKAHIVYDPHLACPIYHVVSAANVNDIVAAKKLPRKCRSIRVPLTSTTLAIMITAGGPNSMRPAAASSRASNPTRPFTPPKRCPSQFDVAY